MYHETKILSTFRIPPPCAGVVIDNVNVMKNGLSYVQSIIVHSHFILPVHRELLEESGLTVNELQEAGILKFEYLGESEILEVHVFTACKFEGTPTESEGNKKVDK